MICKKCGKYVPDNSVHCPYCGKKITRSFDFPLPDVELIAFGGAEEVKQHLSNYSNTVRKYILKKYALTVSIIAVVLCFLVGHICYQQGFKDNQPIASDSSPIVYITPSGSKYHTKNCDYLTEKNMINISITKAKNKGYTPCSQCKAKSIMN